MADAMGRAEGSGGEQQGDARDGDAQLLYQHPNEDDEVGILDEKDDCDRHGGLFAVLGATGLYLIDDWSRAFDASAVH